jgi:hypothetical protein
MIPISLHEPLPRMSRIMAAQSARAVYRGRQFRSRRVRAADLAHGVKTPLAALSAQSRRAREAGANAAAVGLDQAIAAATAAVEASSHEVE